MSTRTSLNVSLTPELADFVRGCVDSGSYVSASEVVRESLRLLMRRRDERALLVDEVRDRIEAAYRSSLEDDALNGGDVVRSLRERVRERRESQPSDGG